MTDSRERPIRKRIDIIQTFWLENKSFTASEIGKVFFLSNDSCTDEEFDHRAKEILRVSGD